MFCNVVLSLYCFTRKQGRPCRKALFAKKIIIILLRSDFRRNFLLCISRLEIESRIFIRKSNLNEITPYIGGLRIPPNPHPKIGVEGSGSDYTCLACSIFVPNELHVQKGREEPTFTRKVNDYFDTNSKILPIFNCSHFYVHSYFFIVLA